MKITPFSQVSSERRTPAALRTGTLRDLLRWLMLQCGSKTAACAAKCRLLVEALTRLVPGQSKSLFVIIVAQLFCCTRLTIHY